ncbi:acyltransferase family protein [Novilysobacter spongiicola]|uniref:Peptidoglycan/LPS O-acetylase OafA/YrhL, contains acyltransferase and SGNH-hydrolase domains n=1 Tax=Lysobacter spongiicola DSM 21749 TaxID=1122188 RepID=A0A1T4S7G4_9GAMM|nr:acyltransferase [Lysobacter spongiicola]SKA24006.1 Peptidoglycan/LPS O-acetylase OafA/YrhL, contains acyltransferase and SGNH-hydrolase domains [Lysobacter spongiicola DSM 21749]
MTDHRPTYLPIQALRAGAALLVVLFHLRIVEARFGSGEPLLPGAMRFADAGVDIFFVISGFVMATVASGRYRSVPNAGRFLARRAWRVLPPYWIYTSLVVVLMLVAPGIANSSYQDQSILASYLLWPQHQLPVLTVGWTLIHEMYFYLVMAGALAFLQERHMPLFLLAWALAVLVAHAALGARPPWLALASNPMTLEFIAGAFVGLYWRRMPERTAGTCAVLGAVALVAAIVVLDRRVDADVLPPSLRTLVFGPAAALVVLGLLAARRRPEGAMGRWLTLLGDSSYSLYLSHVFVVSAAGRLWQVSGFNQSGWQHLVFIVVTVIACVAAGISSWRWVERPLLGLPRSLRQWPLPARMAPTKPGDEHANGAIP